MLNSISFKANFIKNVYIQKDNFSNNPLPVEVSLVELNAKDKNDIDVLEDTNELWNNVKEEYSKYIFYDAYKENEGIKNPRENVKKRHYYAITTQTENYNILEANKILGLAQFSEKEGRYNKLDWLQVNPTTSFTNTDSQQRPYQGVGKILLEHIKNVTEKALEVSSSNKAIPFYQKQGFYPSGFSKNYLYYEKLSDCKDMLR